MLTAGVGKQISTRHQHLIQLRSNKVEREGGAGGGQTLSTHLQLLIQLRFNSIERGGGWGANAFNTSSTSDSTSIQHGSTRLKGGRGGGGGEKRFQHQGSEQGRSLA